MSVKELVRNCTAGEPFLSEFKQNHSEKIIYVTEIDIHTHQLMKYLLHRIKTYLFTIGHSSERVSARIEEMCHLNPNDFDGGLDPDIEYDWTDMELTILTNWFADDVVHELRTNDISITNQRLKIVLRKVSVELMPKYQTLRISNKSNV